MKIPSEIITSWGLTQGINGYHLSNLVYSDSMRRSIRWIGCLIAGLLVLLLLTDKYLTLPSVMLVAVITTVVLFGRSLPEQERQVVNLVRKDFKKLQAICQFSRKVLKNPHEQSDCLERYYSYYAKFNPGQLDSDQNPIKQSVLAEAAWLRFRELAREVERQEPILALLKKHNQSSEWSVREEVRDNINKGLEIGHRFSLFGSHVTVGRFFDPKGPGNLWIS